MSTQKSIQNCSDKVERPGGSTCRSLRQDCRHGDVVSRGGHVRSAGVCAATIETRGQAQFRHSLDVAYGGRCCVSGCGVAWAIDAAHVEPTEDSRSNAVANGLLLRGDLHALFDAGQLAIHPTSHVVYFAEEARAYEEYDNLHGSQTLQPPQSGYEGCAPAAEGILFRWQAFLRDHGDPETQ